MSIYKVVYPFLKCIFLVVFGILSQRSFTARLCVDKHVSYVADEPVRRYRQRASLSRWASTSVECDDARHDVPWRSFLRPEFKKVPHRSTFVIVDARISF